MEQVNKSVAVLFAGSDSVYKQFQYCDVYDKDRDARTYPGGLPVVAHPPCRGWGRLRMFARPEPGEKELAIWAIEQVRRFGGVLEHPETSLLWRELDLPLGKQRDAYGGFTLSVDQFWWGHRARKRTWLYIVGVEPADIPAIALRFDAITHTVSTTMRRGRVHFVPKPKISKAESEHTPPKFATFLINLAMLTTKNPHHAYTI